MALFSPRENWCLEFLKLFWHILTTMYDIRPEWTSLYRELVAIGQEKRLFEGAKPEDLAPFFGRLEVVDRFYREMGGIEGYQQTVLKLLKHPQSSFKEGDAYSSPPFFHIEEMNSAVQEAIEWGLDALPEMAEMIPLGGAADRLHLLDETTRTELPAARLPFAGRPLLETLLRDLEAREFLYYQKTGRQVTTPIAVMTSEEKNNHRHVIAICEEAGWFGRPSDSFRFFTQPLVPTVDEAGNWILLGPLKPLCKPGGHGAIWKLARDAGIFDWLKSLGRKKTLVRQINNPIAGLDYGLLAFTGYGWKRGMRFGFASCPTLPNAAEGINVLISRSEENKLKVVLTNIEYCDFAKCGITDTSRFSSNTNILFADLEAVANAVATIPFPGLLINAKKAVYTTTSGDKKEAVMARLESTMQNIADVFVETKPLGAPLKTDTTYITYNPRHKTISTAKRAYVPGGTLLETPEKCFYDLLLAHRELLEKYCRFELPPQSTLEESIKKGPDFVFLYHPALGPLYSLIAEKMQKGRLALHSELILEVAHFFSRNLEVEGSLQILADRITGHRDPQGVLRFSDQVGSCVLENVRVVNKGVLWQPPFWKMAHQRKESVRIVLRGKSRFVARNVELKGNLEFIVEDGMELELSESGKKYHSLD